MKKLFLFVVVAATVLSLFANRVSAQTQTVTQVCNANVTVAAAIVLTNNNALNFGTVVQGATNVTVDPVNGGGNAGKFTLTQAPASQVLNVSWTNTSFTNGTQTFTWTPSLSGNSVNTQGSSSALTNGGTATVSGTGTYYFWVGGTIATVPSNATGAYSGTLTLTVSY